MRLTAAYCTLANGGISTEPHFIRSISDADGKKIYEAHLSDKRAVKASTAYMITDMLKTAAKEGSAKALASAGVPVAGKTGTVENPNGGTNDIWTACYTPDTALCVWMGFDNPDSEHTMSSTEGGSGYPARLCAAFLKSLNLKSKAFLKPNEVTSVVIDRYSLENDHVARLITDNTPKQYSIMELFHSDDLPETYSGYWSAPLAVFDLQIIRSQNQAPVICFTALEGHAEYVVFRKTDTETSEIAILTGPSGTQISFADIEHNPKLPCEYTVIPRNGLLYASGTLLTGPESHPISYSPMGLWDKIMGADPDYAESTPTEFEVFTGQSLFG